MLDRVRPSLLAGLKSRAGVAASRPTEIRPAGDEQVIVRETEARVTAISDRAELAFIYEARSEEHTSELQSLMRISYAVFCLKKKKKITQQHTNTKTQTYNTTS